MTRPSRVRRMLKWTGVGLSFLVLLIWAASLALEYTFVFSDFTAIQVSSGSVRAATADYNLRAEVGLVAGLKWERYKEIGLRTPRAAYREERGAGSEIINLGTVNPLIERHSRIWIPLWLPLLLTAIPTAWLWHRDRRLISCSPDHLLCSGCGYDLTGNTSGVCSECGEPKPPPAIV